MKLINFSCDKCKEVDCKYLKKIKQAISEIDITEDANDLPVYILGGDDYSFYYGSYRNGDEINISCRVLKVRTKDEICESLKNFLNSEWITEHYGYVNDDGEEVDENDGEDEESGDGNLSREEKIKKLKKILGIEESIEIIESSEINGHVDSNGSIFITTAALNELDLDEIAAIFAHEEGHINSDHIAKKVTYIDDLKNKVHLIANCNEGFFAKVGGMIAVGVLGGIGFVGLSHAQEIEADLKGQKILEDAGFGEEGAEKLLRRVNNGFSLTHPSSNLRRNIIKRDG